MFRFQIDEYVELRQLEMSCVRELFELLYRNRHHVGEWMFWIGENFTFADAENYILRGQERLAAKNGFEAEIRFKGDLAGCIYYRYIDQKHRNTEIGYWLGAEFQGKGLMTKACRAMVDYAFWTLQLNRVEIRCMSENLKSRQIPVKLGFRQEGVLRQVRWRKDHFDDHIVYGMLASEWQSQRETPE